MDASVAFVLPLGFAGLAAASSMVADGMRKYRASAVVGAVFLILGAASAGVAAFGTSPSVAFDAFVVGAGYSGGACFVLILAACAVLSLAESAESRAGSAPTLIALAAAAAVGLTGATDLLMMLIALETLAILGYAIVSSAGGGASAEAALKYFVQGTIATSILVLGFGGVLAARVPAGIRFGFESGGDITAVGLATAAAALIFVAFAFKLGAFPFHAWAPDAYDTAPPAGAAFLASATKIAAFVASYTVLVTIVSAAGINARIQWILASIAAASIVFGNLAALSQKRYARLLAYSGIAQVGYGLVGLVVGSGAPLLLFVVAYALAVGGAFIAAESILSRRPGWDGSIEGLAGLAREAPVVSGAIAVLLFSMTGIPPLMGFWGKFLVFLRAVETNWAWLALIGVLGSVVSFGYYGRILRWMYFDEAPDATQGDTGGESPTARVSDWMVVILAAVILVGGVVLLVNGFGGVAVESAGSFGALRLVPVTP